MYVKFFLVVWSIWIFGVLGVLSFVIEGYYIGIKIFRFILMVYYYYIKL